MSTRLASFPSSRNNQIPADAKTYKFNVTDVAPVEISMPSNDRAYILLRNTTGNILRYFYEIGDYLVGMPLNPSDSVRIVNRKAVYIQLESGSGDASADIGIG